MQQIKDIAAAAIIGSLAALGATTGAQANDFTWQYSAYNDPANGGRYTAYLTHGVPETDDVQFQATCSPRGQSAVLGYNTGDLPNGRQVVVGFYQNGREVYAKSGTVYHGDGEEGVAGVLFDTEINDGLWVSLARGNRIRYGIKGLRRARMHLRGSSRMIRKFRNNCRAIQNASNDVEDDFENEENNVASAPSCNGMGRLQSIDSGQPVTIQFVNRSGTHRTVMWLDYEGQPKHYKDLAAGESYRQQTFVGHPWMFTDGPGNCKEIFTPRAGGPTRYVITFSE